MRPAAARTGVALAALGALSYGVTVVVGRDLAGAGVSSSAALGWRFGTGGLFLLGLLRLRRAPLLPARGEVAKVFLLGAVGYATESTFFYLALERGTAAATALIFYIYPAIVTVIELARGRERAELVTLLALALSVTGTAVVVAGGRDVAISPGGAVFALAAASTFAAYLLVGRDLGTRSDAMTIACWVALGAAVSNLGRGLLAADVTIGSHRWLEVALYGAATAAAFSLMFAAIERIGATRAAVVMSLEAFSAVVLGAVLLGEELRAIQLLGGAAVLGAATLIGTRAAPVPVPLEAAEPP